MSNTNKIKEAVRILLDPSLNKEEILLELALTTPSAFLKAVEKNCTKPEWLTKIENYASNGQKIEAIKALIDRKLVTSLIYAKSAVEYFSSTKRWPEEVARNIRRATKEQE